MKFRELVLLAEDAEDDILKGMDTYELLHAPVYYMHVGALGLSDRIITVTVRKRDFDAMSNVEPGVIDDIRKDIARDGYCVRYNVNAARRPSETLFPDINSDLLKTAYHRFIFMCPDKELFVNVFNTIKDAADKQDLKLITGGDTGLLKEDTEDDVLAGMDRYEENYMPVYEFSNWGSVRSSGVVAIVRFRNMSQFSQKGQEILKHGEMVVRLNDIFTTNLDAIVDHIKKDKNISVVHVSSSDSTLYNKVKEKFEKAGITFRPTNWV